MALYCQIQRSSLRESTRIDAEYHKPADVAMEALLVKNGATPLKRHIVGFSSGKNLGQFPSEEKNLVPFIRTQNVRRFLVSEAGLSFCRCVASATVQNGDILAVRVGAGVGDLSIVGTEFENACISDNVLRIRVAGINPFYLVVYLLSRRGQQFLHRSQKGTARGLISSENFHFIPIPHIDPILERQCESKLLAAEASAIEARKLYTNANQLLEEALGLNRLKFLKPVGYSAQFSEVEVSRRADADYFQVAFRQIHSLLDSLTTVPLARLASIAKGIEVGSKSYAKEGRLFIRVSNLKEGAIQESSSDKYISDSLYQSLSAFRAEVGELLLTKDGSPGVCFAVDEEIDGIICSGIVKLKPFTDRVPNEYLALAINSKVCRMQIEQECSGALILHWKPSSIRKLRIPILADEVMDEIAALVSSSKEAKRESERLLNEAKARVEQLIEEAVKS